MRHQLQKKGFVCCGGRSVFSARRFNSAVEDGMPQIVDLTVTLSNNMPGHRFFPRPVILPHFTHEEMETWGNGTPEDPLGGCTTYLGMIDHMGTHIDAFIHTKRGGATIDEMPLDMFIGKAV